MRKILVGLLSLILVFAVATTVRADKPSDIGFDDSGYNWTANIFNGIAWDWCMKKVNNITWCEWFLGQYKYDNIVMKWNNEWVRGNSEGWSNPPYRAWENNEWNGAFPGGSGSVWHYKIVWVGSCGADGTPLPNGGYCIWGQFATIMDQGIDPAYGPGHWSFALAAPAGYGSYVNPNLLPTPTP